jgi:hypothetical protein
LVSSHDFSSCDYYALNIEIGLTKNPRMTADELSEISGLDVYVPDILYRDPIPTGVLKDFPEIPGEKMSIGTKVVFLYHYQSGCFHVALISA